MPQDVRAYQAFIEHSPVPMVLFDRRTLRYLAVNGAALKLYGYRRRQMLAMTLKDVRRPSDVPRLARAIKDHDQRPHWHGVLTPRRKDGRLVEVEVYSRPLTVAGRPAILATIIDASERQAAQAQLAASREMLDGVLANVPDFVVEIDRNNRILFINRTPKGIAMKDALGRSALRLIAPRDRARAARDSRRVFATGRPRVNEIQALGDGGELRTYQSRLQPVFEGGKVKSVLIVISDITDRKAAERDLAASNEMLDAVLTNVPDFVTRMDRRGKLLYINKIGKGLKKSELIGSSGLDYAHPADRPRLRRAMGRVLKSGKPALLETRRLGPGGKTRFYRNWLQRIVDKSGEASVLAVSSDVTAIREAEEKKRQVQEELERSRNLLDGVMANVPAFVLKIDPRLRIAFINRLAKGFKMSDVIGRKALDYIDPRDRARIGRDLRAVFRTGRPAAAEMRGQGDLGRTRYYFARYQPVFEKGRVDSVLMLSTDITDRRKAEEELKKSQESYRLIFEANPSPMVVGERATHRWLAVNDAAVKHYGYSREEWLRMSSKDIHPPAEFERLKRYRIGYGLASHGVWKQRKKDGTIIDVDITTNSLQFQGREAIMGVFRDVTEEQRTQAALRRSRQDYFSLFRGHPLPMWVGDYETLRVLDVNDAAVKALGYPREEFLGKRVTELRPRSEVSTLMARIKSKKPGMMYQGATIYRRKDGSCFDAEAYVSDLEYQGRRAFITSIIDISAEQRAREAQERFAGLFNASRDGMNFIDMQGRIRDVNQALCRMLGYERGELLGKHTLRSLTPPEYHQMNREAFDHLLKTGQSVEYEKEYIRKDGSRVPVSLTAFVLPGADGRPAGLAGIVRDITERKRLEKEILEIGAREQSHIGRELHDSLGQHLTGLSFLAKSLKTQLSREGSPQARLAERISQTASDAVEQVRALAAGLVPAELLPNGLPAALRAMAVQAEKTFDIEVSVSCAARLTGMDEAALLHLYRIAQEATANAAKHSGASKVRIALRETAGRLVLEVSDDGKGIARRGGKGLGLRIMAHRAQMLGGSFEAKRGRSGGTVVTCSCPVRRPLL